MRQLFLPACICLVTWSGATSSDAGLTLEEFTSKRQVSGNIAIPPEETASAVVAIPREETQPPAAETSVPDLTELTALAPDLAAEYPVPSGVVINNGIPIGIPLPPRPKPVVDRSEEEVCHALTTAAQQNDVPAPFFIRLLFQESRFRPEVVSHAGAQGIAQFMPETADQMGLDNPYDPVQAIAASARLLRDLVKQFGNLGLAAAAYNAGPKRVADWLAAKGKSKLPEETQGYVKTITGKPVEHWSTAGARHPAQKLPEEAPCQNVAGLLAAAGPDELPLPVASPLRANTRVADDKPADKKPKPAKTAKAEDTTSRGQPKKDHATPTAATAKPTTTKRERIAQR
ncbi:lytic transglycosylase domain-containing protein [Pseudolabrys sp. FHR47]|uniref:lytic transglycosylase domain-containing protein n=1 Tax=Pseudolabrys sp. FHR47 TaxID=2562284 RepID=UPI0010BEE1DE|nr:lytic transglycosylase domain-containing protein [Pseudolabrys sp. FHR47]